MSSSIIKRIKQHKGKAFIALALTFILIFASLYVTQRAYADSSAVVNAPGFTVYVRTGPGTNYSYTTYLEDQTPLTVIGKETGNDGKIWYKVHFSGGNGYMRSDFVTITGENAGGTSWDEDYKPDADFEAYLSAQGFPESYKESLRNLHSHYPKWRFVALQTGLDWQQVIDKETAYVSTNLIENHMPGEWKSTDPRAFDAKSGKYIIFFDSGDWVAASKEAVACYMDPRNFLDAAGVFQFLSNKYDGATQTPEALNTMIADSFLAKPFPESTYSSYASLLLDAGSTYGVSPITLASIFLAEQGWDGSGGSIQGTYNGCYNFFNIGAYAGGDYDAVTCGLIYAKTRGWNTRTKSVLEGTKWYADNYINGGQHTYYLKKFNVMNGLSSVATHQYMTNVRGAALEGRLGASAYSALVKNGAGLTFEIPVYDNMPAAPEGEPGSRDNINYLSALSVDGYSLTPTFSPYTGNYELVVPNSAGSIRISATPVSSNARISGTGTTALAVGANKLQIVCTASSGSTRTYTLNITRQAASGDTGGGGTGGAVTPADPPTVTEVAPATHTYSIGDTLTGLKPGTSISAFLSSFNKGTGAVRVYTKDGKEVTSGLVGSGMRVKTFDSRNRILQDIPIILRGDANGDGKVNSLDALIIQKYVVGTIRLSGVNLIAADVSKDGKSNSFDALMIQKYVVGTANIQF